MQALLNKMQTVSIITTNQVQYETIYLKFDVNPVEVNQENP